MTTARLMDIDFALAAQDPRSLLERAAGFR